MIKRILQQIEHRQNLISSAVMESSALLFLLSLALVVYILSQPLF